MSARIENKTCGCALPLINNRHLKSDSTLYFRNWPCDGLRAMRKYMSFVFHPSRFERLSKRLLIIYTRESGAESSSGGISARRTPHFRGGMPHFPMETFSMGGKNSRDPIRMN